MFVKYLFSFLACISFALSVNSQLSAVDYKDEKFISFKASKTFIVKTGNEKFDSELLQAFKDSWKLTPYDVISKEEFDKKINYTNHINKKKDCSILDFKKKYNNLEIEYQQLKQINQELKIENNKINELLEKCITNKNNIITNTNNTNNNIINNTNNTNNTINIKLVNFGQESYKKLTKEEKQHILK